ncbi:MAG: HAMP domain-containing protein [Opitutaceae bacterium]|nr:HAMP domain-containing protein [Opitutaceae bacterium]
MKFSLRDVPIRRKLMGALLLTSVTVMLLMRGSFFTYEYLNFRSNTARQLGVMGRMIAANSTAALAFENEPDAREILSALRVEPQVTAAALYTADGRLFTSFAAPDRASPLPASPGETGFRFTGARLAGFQPVLNDQRRLGTLYLEYDTGPVMRTWLRDSVTIALAVMGVVLVVAYLLARALQRQISAPIVDLARTAQAVSERGDYSVRALPAGGGEIRQLTDAFNQMLTQIEALNRELERRVAARTAELEIANKELEAFSYSVSHDLRAPLRHIDGFAGLLVKADGERVSERGRKYLATIASSARQMGTLIDDLLVFSRMGRSEMTFRDVDLRQLVDEEIRTLQAQNPDRRIRWDIGPLPVVPGDRPMLRQVLVNLLANAVKYTGPRDPAEISVGARPDGAGKVVVHVRDNGVGFDMQYADKLFGVFQRLHRAEEFEGTGIGLANVRRIVSRHGGETWAEAAVGAGATFFFSLPLSRPALS